MIQERKVFSDKPLESERDQAVNLSTEGLIRVCGERPRPATEIRTFKGEMLKHLTYFDANNSAYQPLTDKIVIGRTERYYDKGIWKTRHVEDPVRSNGHEIEFVVMLEPTEELIPCASLRKVHTASWQDIENLPTFQKFSEVDAFAPDARQELYEQAITHEVVEIAALYNNKDRDVTLALFGLALRDSILRNEVWFMGIVSPLYDNLRNTFGERVVRDMGQAIPVNDGLAKDSVRIRPAYVGPAELPANLLHDMDEAAARNDKRTFGIRKFILLNIIQQFDFEWGEYFSPEIVRRLNNLRNAEMPNPYISREGEWSAEADRLRSMDALLAFVTDKDLRPILESDQDSFRYLLDIGAGTGDKVRRLSEQHGVTYIALDVNAAMLDMRDDEEHKVKARSESLPFADDSIDITYSRAATAWSANPRAAIDEQLRVSQKAVFTEFDWSTAGPGDSTDSESLEEAELIIRMRDTILGVLMGFGFRPNYGSQASIDIDEVIENKDFKREQQIHTFPEGNYSELLLGVVESLVQQLRLVATDQAIQIADSLRSDAEKLQNLPRIPSFYIPNLVTQTVCRLK